MEYLEIILETNGAAIEELAAVLTAAGFEEFVMEDQAEYEEFLDQNRNYWDYIDEQLQAQIQGVSRIKLYFEETDRDSLSRLKALVAQLQGRELFADLALEVKNFGPIDWDGWKENYPPQPIGQKLVVLPYWEDPARFPDRLPVILDPGLTFGTGAHPSTQMVMGAMEKAVKPGDNCLDLGSGSGILSIAALRLGAAHATGVDIDPKAEDIARENAAYNGFDSQVFTAYTGNVTADKALMQTLSRKTYQVVLVNIVADVIIALAPVLPRFLGADTRLICSGILDERLGDVVAALTRAGIAVTATHAQEDWRCVEAKL